MVLFPKIRIQSPMRLALVLIACAASACAGCHRFPRLSVFSRNQQQSAEAIPAAPVPPSYSVFASPLFKASPPRRIVMIASGPDHGSYGETNKLMGELASLIRTAGKFEVVTPDYERLSTYSDNIIHGKFDEREIAELSHKYNADAVALVRVNELRTHSPMRASATMAIIDSNEAIVSFAVDGNWDTAQPGVLNEFQNFVSTRNSVATYPNAPTNILLQSPTNLLSFVASKIVESLGY